jgi:predicted TIM-barrel fold metal-dependent hydrolase
MTPPIDLTAFPVIDAHCHSYLESPKVLTADELARYSSILAVPPDFLSTESQSSEAQKRKSRTRLSQMYSEQLYTKHMIRMLSQFLKCEPSFEAVAVARSRRANDFDDYVKALFDNVRLQGLVLDGGYPPLPEEDLKRFPAKVVRVFRIETFIKTLLERYDSFEEFCSAYESGIRDAIKRDGYVGLKSIIAYRTGLKIRRVPLEDAKRDFKDAKDGSAAVAWFGPRIKSLRDFLLIKALELSITLDVPMQIHTGVGDYDILLDQCDPSLMYDLLKDEELRHATVVLVHSGFPNSQNAAFMASVLPNVFLDFSLTIPFLNPVSHERLMEILQIAPASKIMYGSDGFSIPEIFWLGAKVSKKVLEKCFEELVKGDALNEAESERMARRILFENSNALYELKFR